MYVIFAKDVPYKSQIHQKRWHRVVCIERKIFHHRELLPSYCKGDDEEQGSPSFGERLRIHRSRLTDR